MNIIANISPIIFPYILLQDKHTYLHCIRAPPKRSKTVVLAKMQKLHHLKQISELNIPVGVIFNGNA